MKWYRTVLFSLFVASLVWGAWIVTQKVVVWEVPDPTEYCVEITFFDWMVSALPGAGLLFACTLILALCLSFSYRWVFERRILWRILLFPIPILVLAGMGWGSISGFIDYHEHKFYAYAGPVEENSPGEQLMRKVAGMKKLVAAAPFPDDPDAIQGMHLKGEAFDVESYFTILTNLSKHAGYILDYVHVGSADGFPILYSRKKDEAPYQSAQEFIDSLPPGAWQPTGDYLRDWSPAIQMEPTTEAFLELAALHLVGNQFYLYWHANYNDRIIIASAAKLEEVINSDICFSGGLPIGYRMKACELDVRPEIEFVQERAVWVSLLTFTKWGGFIREELAFSTEYPHKLLMRESETLIEYQCGVCY